MSKMADFRILDLWILISRNFGSRFQILWGINSESWLLFGGISSTTSSLCFLPIWLPWPEGPLFSFLTENFKTRELAWHSFSLSCSSSLKTVFPTHTVWKIEEFWANQILRENNFCCAQLHKNFIINFFKGFQFRSYLSGRFYVKSILAN